MNIQVLGTGCNTCKNLFEITKKAVSELGIEAEVEYITDITKLIEMGIMTSPVLMIEGRTVMNGFSDDIEKIKDLILFSKKNDSVGSTRSENCSCGSDCC